METFLLVGLGNPGKRHENNRHNVGFMVLDAVAAASSCSFKKVASVADVAVCAVGDRRIILSKPLTYMNLSGNAVRFLSDFYKIPVDDVCVCHDDVDLHSGRVKIKKGGGSGGHNGLRSIDSLMGDGYWRLRIGVGRPPEKSMMTAHVLGDFSEEDGNILRKIIASLAENVDLLFLDRQKLEMQLNSLSDG
ncbi:MAG: aminoacyl-tRNA hydrolase [Holosporaceae bacterium]|jgi:PTH1 family peptidyl-tRNA hydrolase|nr:aminoacyl-tRNA hydrolase [Holosporaceae bacterium]